MRNLVFRNEKCGQRESSKRVVENVRKQTACDRVQIQSSKPQSPLGGNCSPVHFVSLRHFLVFLRKCWKGFLWLTESQKHTSELLRYVDHLHMG